MDKNPDQFNLFDEEPKKPIFQHKKPDRSSINRLAYIKNAKTYVDKARTHGGPGAMGRVIKARDSGDHFEQLVLSQTMRKGSNYPLVGKMIELAKEDLKQAKLEKDLGCLACGFLASCEYEDISKSKPILDQDYQVTDPLLNLMFSKNGKKIGQKLIDGLEKDINQSCPEIIKGQ